METRKYKLTEETIAVCDRILYRIEALKDFNDVKKGDKGGFVENEDNLSQYKDSWIYDDAKVYGNARIYDDVKVYDKAEVCDNAIVYDNAVVYGNARIYDDVKVYGHAMVFDDAMVYDNAEVFDNANVYDDAKVYGCAKVCDNAKVRGHCCVADNAKVCGNTKACDDVLVCDNAEVCGEAKVFGHATICGDAVIISNSDYIVFKNWWSSGRYFTWTRSNNMWKVGCFYGTGEQLINKAYKDSELSGREYERVVRYIDKDYPEIIKNQQENKRAMTEQEIFEKIKEALDYNYMYDSFEYGEERKEVDNLEDYLRIIKQEREIEKGFEDAELNRLNTYKEFVHYLNDKAIGNKDSLIECFEDNSVNIFNGYKTVTKMLIDGKLYLEFEVGDTKYKAEWQTSDNYAVWQTCGMCGDDYSGYLLFPTYKDDEYFCLWYQC